MIGARVELDLSPAEGLRKTGLRKATRIGLNRAAAPVKTSVVAHADAVKRYGFLGKSIRIRIRTYPADRFVAVVGPSSNYVRKKGKFTRGKNKGKPRVKIPAKYGHLVEGGTKRSLPRPWLKPAHDASAPRFLQQAALLIGQEVERELIRHPPQVRGT